MARIHAEEPMMRALARYAALLALALVPTGRGPSGAAVPPPPSDGSGMWGVGVGAWPHEARRRGFPFPPDLGEVRDLGANHVLIPITLSQPTIHASDIGPDAETISDVDLRSLIRAAHRAELRVTLMPILEIRRGARHHWRGVIRPADPDAWWRDYTRRVRHYAQIAEREGVATLVVGSELSSLATPEHAPRWRRLSEVVRLHYSGPLAWVSNHDALDRRAPLAFVDIAGVSAYFPLADDPDVDEADLEARFREVARSLAEYRHQVGMPLVLYEVGFPSIDGAAMAPWDYTSGAPVDLEEQRAAYAAVATVLSESDFVDGALFWGWFGPGGAHDRYYTPRDKPAEAELVRLLAARRRGVGDGNATLALRLAP